MPTVVKHMVAQGEFAISAAFVTNGGGGGIDYDKARALWAIIRGPAECTAKLVLQSMANYYDQFNYKAMSELIYAKERQE